MKKLLKIVAALSAVTLLLGIFGAIGVVGVFWHFGRGLPDSKQLVGYAAWASFHLDRKASDIEPIIVYLHPEYEEISLNPTEDELIEYKERIFSETKEMYGYCRNFEENIPLDKEAFPLLEDTAICRYCNYKELCHRN